MFTTMLFFLNVFLKTLSLIKFYIFSIIFLNVLMLLVFYVLIISFIFMKNMKIFQSSLESKIDYDDICLIDSVTTHKILRDKKYFFTLL